MLRLLRWLLTPFMVILALAIGQSLIRAAWSTTGSETTTHSSYWLGMALPLAFLARASWAFLCKRQRWDNFLAFTDTLEHEMTHALFGYLTLHPPVSLKASLRGEGEVMLKGSNPFIILAPYFFPLTSAVLVLVSLWVAAAYRLPFQVLCLASLGSFLFRLMAEFRWRQSDLHAYGFVFSCAMVSVLLLMTMGVLLSLLGLLPWHWLAFIPGYSGQGLMQFFREASAGARALGRLLRIPFQSSD
jgi:hypothetical protein